jgi:glycosyltransferase involved in cell wall biosynthesis
VIAMSEPIRVVVVDHVARMSGAEIATLRLVEALGSRVAVHAVLGEDGPLVAALQDAGARVTVLPLPPKVRDLRRDDTVGAGRRSALGASSNYAWQLARLLRRERPDLVHTVSLKAALYGGLAGRLALRPVVWHVHDLVDETHLPGPTVRTVRRAARRLPRLVMANSAATLASLPGAREGRVVPNPVPEPRLSAAPAAGRVRTVGMVGRIAPWKGQDVFLRAFSEAFPVPSRTRAVLAGVPLFGEEAFAARLESLARALRIRDRVDFLGPVDDVDAVLADLDVLVHCSVLPEPFGQVIVEGMAAGVPVVAAAAGGPTEIVTDGLDGLLTSPGDVGDLAFALSRLDYDPALRRRLSQGGFRRAADFSPQRAADAVLGAYGVVLSRDR